MALTARRPARAGAWIALSATVIVATLLRLRLLGVPLERDEGEYAYMGQLILRGDLPYLAAQNMKLPGTYYAYAVILRLFGETDTAIRAGLLLVNLCSILLVYRLGRRLCDVTAGVVAAAAFATLSLGACMLGFTANAEHFVVLPMLGGALLLAADDEHGLGRLFTAGTLLGLAFVMKQHGIAFVAFGGLYVLASARERRHATWTAGAAFAFGAVVPFATTCAAMFLAGAFEPFWFWTFRYAREYATLIPLRVGLAELVRQAGLIAGAAPLLWTLAVVGLSAPAWDAPSRRSARFLRLFASCSALAVCPGLRFTEHYFLLLVPAASLLAGLAVSALGRAVASRGSWVDALVGIGLPLLAVASALAADGVLWSRSPIEVSRAVYGANPFPEAIELARYLRAHTDPDEQVGVVGSEPEIYFYARRRAATTYVYTYPMMEPQPFARAMQDDMIAQLERANPRYLVLVNVDTSWSRRPDSSTKLLDWAARTVNERYDAVALADIRDDGTTYRWDEAARGASPTASSYVVIFRRRS
jgi:hypothetical protein